MAVPTDFFEHVNQLSTHAERCISGSIGGLEHEQGMRLSEIRDRARVLSEKIDAFLKTKRWKPKPVAGQVIGERVAGNYRPGPVAMMMFEREGIARELGDFSRRF